MSCHIGLVYQGTTPFHEFCVIHARKAWIIFRIRISRIFNFEIFAHPLTPHTSVTTRHTPSKMAANDKAKDFDWAVKNGDLAGVKTFVEKDGVNPATLKDANSRGPVHWASDYVCPSLLGLSIVQ
jgi:hypothetical protein